MSHERNRTHDVIQALGPVIGGSTASADLRQQLGIPNTVLQAANHHGIWDVTALLPYLKSVTISAP